MNMYKYLWSLCIHTHTHTQLFAESVVWRGISVLYVLCSVVCVHHDYNSGNNIKVVSITRITGSKSSKSNTERARWYPLNIAVYEYVCECFGWVRVWACSSNFTNNIRRFHFYYRHAKQTKKVKWKTNFFLKQVKQYQEICYGFSPILLKHKSFKSERTIFKKKTT